MKFLSLQTLSHLLALCGCLLFFGCAEERVVSGDWVKTQSSSISKNSGETDLAPEAGADGPGLKYSDSSQLHQSYSISNYIGSAACADCHQQAYASWEGSHHQLAMAEPSVDTVIGDFANQQITVAGVTTKFLQKNSGYYVVTDGPDNKLTEYSIRYTFGISPLQQYLVDIGGGRMQALPTVWDGRKLGGESLGWYHLNPVSSGVAEDVTHWTKGGQNWNHMCADCHSTGVTKGYDASSDTFNTQFAEVSVGCEACHGPGSLHSNAPGDVYPMLPGSNNFAGSEQNACAACHSRRHQLGEGFTPQQSFFDFYQPALLDQGLYYPDGQILDEVYVYGSFAQSKMHAQGVTCSNCHDSHSAQLKFEGNGLCTQCHNPVGRAEFPTLKKAVYDSPRHHFHKPANAESASSGSACVDCHMPSRVYMGVDDRHDHSFRIPRPDLSAKIGVPNACASCHEDDQGSNVNQWAEAVIARHFKHSQRKQKPAHYGEALFAARLGRKFAETPLIAVATNAQLPAIVRGTALSLLRSYTLSGGSRAIEQGLNAADPLVRIGAIRGSQRWPAQRQWRALKPLLNDPLLAIRSEVVATIAGLYQSLPADEKDVLFKAIQTYIQTQRVSADRPESLSNIASMYLNIGDVVAAEGSLNTALELNPQWVPALINLADIYRGTGRDEQGGLLLDRALELTPNAADVLLAKALWWVRQGDRARAIALLEQGYDVNSASSLNYIYAVALHSDGQTAKALDIVDAAMKAQLLASQLVQLGLTISRDTADPERARRYQAYLDL